MVFNNLYKLFLTESEEQTSKDVNVGVSSPEQASSPNEPAKPTPNSLLPRHEARTEAHVEITAFKTGRMVTETATLVQDAQGHSMATSWRFLLRHAASDTDFWFDMGISDDLSVYPPSVQDLHAHFQTLPSETSIEDDTRSRNVDPSSVKYVIVSHAHWDHIHPLPSSFTNATMLVGPKSIAHCTPNYPSSPSSKYDGQIWDPSKRKFKLVELPPVIPSPSLSTANSQDCGGTWKPLGPFTHTYDFFSDGSFYLVNAPGHMQGNLAALCRVKCSTIPTRFPSNSTSFNSTREAESQQYKWILLAGDCAHNSLFTYWPEAPFGKMPKQLFPSGCLHECAEEAREMIRSIAQCKRVEGNRFLVWYAHAEVLEGLWDL